MSDKQLIWQTYPARYRRKQVDAIREATTAGESISLVGLSGAGKSNLLGFLEHRVSSPEHPYILVDCNRLLEATPGGLLRLILRHVDRENAALSRSDPMLLLEGIENKVGQFLDNAERLTIMLDRFDLFARPPQPGVANALRVVRDRYKFRLTYVIATRRMLPADNELSELFHANTIWLGPLTIEDARWSVESYAGRQGTVWPYDVVDRLISVSGAYPSFLRGVCEAYRLGRTLADIQRHPAILARLDEFWKDEPDELELEKAGLHENPLLSRSASGPQVEDEELTAKERLLLDFFQANGGEVCSKDDLIRAVWPEDAIYEEGVRDSSLAQLVRRLRLKIEPDPSDPTYIQTVPGRGYIYEE